MAASQANRAHFAGQQKLATVDDLDAFVRRAAAGQRFTYCEAPDLIRSETSVRVTALAGEGLVRPHRERRAGGGWDFYVVRTGKGLPVRADPLLAALADPATDLVYRALKRAANFAAACPSDEALKRLAGLATRNQAAWRVRKLIDLGLVESTVAYEGGVPFRVVTICASAHAGAAAGKSTALPAKWRALQAAAQRDAGIAR